MARYRQGLVHELTRAANTGPGVVAIRFAWRPDRARSFAYGDSLAERIFASFALRSGGR
ncbi:MAG: hypothetical protein R2909_21710 [Gemmatimonadales bacterium]